MMDDREVIMNGTWIYDGSVSCNVRIIKSDMMYGSGDYEDDSDDSEDKEVECYYVQFEDMTQKGKCCSTRGGFLTLSEAIMETEKVTNQKINWIN